MQAVETAAPADRPVLGPSGVHGGPQRDRRVEPVAGRGVGRPASRLAALDGLRFVAALAVLGYHYTYFGRASWLNGGFPSLASVFKYGWLGVNLFFLISGFVICMSSWGRGLGEFVVSRISRLFPAYWIAVLLTTAVVVLLRAPHLTFRELLDNLTMMQQPLGSQSADGSFWTLWRELLFYLLFAIVVWRGVSYRRVVTFCVLWLLASVVVSAYPNGFVATFVDIEYSMYFVAGIAMYLIYRFRPTLLLWCIIGWSWILAEHQLGRVEGALELGRVPRHWWIATAIVTLSYLVVIAAALGWLDWARWRMLTFVGALTYPLYLVHQKIGLTIVHRLSGVINKYALLAGTVAAMLLLAWLICRFVERPVAPMLRRRLRLAVADAAGRVDPAAPSGRHAVTTARPVVGIPHHEEPRIPHSRTESANSAV